MAEIHLRHCQKKQCNITAKTACRTEPHQPVPTAIGVWQEPIDTSGRLKGTIRNQKKNVIHTLIQKVPVPNHIFHWNPDIIIRSLHIQKARVKEPRSQGPKLTSKDDTK